MIVELELSPDLSDDGRRDILHKTTSSKHAEACVLKSRLLIKAWLPNYPTAKVT